MFKITAYNGTVWESPMGTLAISEVVVLFQYKTGLHEMDIKLIERIN